jgi:hypothetical protein
MDNDHSRDPIVRRIVLPSGKTIEVLQLAEDADLGSDSGAMLEPAPGPVDPHAPEEDATSAQVVSCVSPHFCGDCESTLVYPVAWNAAGSERWSVELRCPNCERTESALLDLEVAEHFDEELERGAETLISDLARLTESNMRDLLDRFTAALEADAIVPSDF